MKGLFCVPYFVFEGVREEGGWIRGVIDVRGRKRRGIGSPTVQVFKGSRHSLIKESLYEG